MDHLFGLPAHPLIVHIPVVLLPLTACGVLVTLLRTRWYERYRWAVLAIGTVGTLGAIYAASSGETLEGLIRASDGNDAARGIHEHAQAGDQARNLAILFLIVLAVYVLLPWVLERRQRSNATDEGTGGSPRWLRPVLMVLVTGAAAASVVSVIDAGHSGASKAWEEYATQNGGDDDGG